MWTTLFSGINLVLATVRDHYRSLTVQDFVNFFFFLQIDFEPLNLLLLSEW